MTTLTYLELLLAVVSFIAGSVLYRIICDSVKKPPFITISYDTKVETSRGKLTAKSYNDGESNGIQIFLNDDIVLTLDVLPDGDTRMLIHDHQEYNSDPTMCHDLMSTKGINHEINLFRY